MSRLRRSPKTLEELAESLKHLETLQGDLAKTEAQIPLIHDQFAILDKYEVSVEQAVRALLKYTVNTRHCISGRNECSKHTYSSSSLGSPTGAGYAQESGWRVGMVPAWVE